MKTKTDNFALAHGETVRTMKLSALDSIPVRTGLSDVRLENIRRAHAKGDKLPPISAYKREDGSLALYDGNHRLKVARELGRKSIRVLRTNFAADAFGAIHAEFSADKIKYQENEFSPHKAEYGKKLEARATAHLLKKVPAMVHPDNTHLPRGQKVESFPSHKPGTWEKETWRGNYGKTIRRLEMLDPHKVALKESTDEKSPHEVEKYAGWMKKKGNRIPPIDSFQNDAGHIVVSNGHHRVLAARKAGVKVPAWVNYRMPTGRSGGNKLHYGPMTHEGAIHGVKKAQTMSMKEAGHSPHEIERAEAHMAKQGFSAIHADHFGHAAGIAAIKAHVGEEKWEHYKDKDKGWFSPKNTMKRHAIRQIRANNADANSTNGAAFHSRDGNLVHIASKDPNDVRRWRVSAIGVKKLGDKPNLPLGHYVEKTKKDAIASAMRDAGSGSHRRAQMFSAESRKIPTTQTKTNPMKTDTFSAIHAEFAASKPVFTKFESRGIGDGRREDAKRDALETSKPKSKHPEYLAHFKEALKNTAFMDSQYRPGPRHPSHAGYMKEYNRAKALPSKSSNFSAAHVPAKMTTGPGNTNHHLSMHRLHAGNAGKMGIGEKMRKKYELSAKKHWHLHMAENGQTDSIRKAHADAAEKMGNFSADMTTGPGKADLKIGGKPMMVTSLHGKAYSVVPVHHADGRHFWDMDVSSEEAEKHGGVKRAAMHKAKVLKQKMNFSADTFAAKKTAKRKPAEDKELLTNHPIGTKVTLPTGMHGHVMGTAFQPSDSGGCHKLRIETAIGDVMMHPHELKDAIRPGDVKKPVGGSKKAKGDNFAAKTINGYKIPSIKKGPMYSIAIGEFRKSLQVPKDSKEWHRHMAGYHNSMAVHTHGTEQSEKHQDKGIHHMMEWGKKKDEEKSKGGNFAAEGLATPEMSRFKQTIKSHAASGALHPHLNEEMQHRIVSHILEHGQGAPSSGYGKAWHLVKSAKNHTGYALVEKNKASGGNFAADKDAMKAPRGTNRIQYIVRPKTEKGRSSLFGKLQSRAAKAGKSVFMQVATNSPGKMTVSHGKPEGNHFEVKPDSSIHSHTGDGSFVLRAAKSGNFSANANEFAAPSSLTNNEFYGGLNKRFKSRTQKMAKMGMQYDKEKVGWSHPGNGSYILRGQPISNEFVLHADKRSFHDRLARHVPMQKNTIHSEFSANPTAKTATPENQEGVKITNAINSREKVQQEVPVMRAAVAMRDEFEGLSMKPAAPKMVIPKTSGGTIRKNPVGVRTVPQAQHGTAKGAHFFGADNKATEHARVMDKIRHDKLPKDGGIFQRLRGARAEGIMRYRKERNANSKPKDAFAALHAQFGTENLATKLFDMKLVPGTDTRTMTRSPSGTMGGAGPNPQGGGGGGGGGGAKAAADNLTKVQSENPTPKSPYESSFPK